MMPPRGCEYPGPSSRRCPVGEWNTVINVRAVAKRIRAAGCGMVGLVGVQSNQFPRALDVRRQFRALGVPVLMGGFHISGCLAMLPAVPLDTCCFKSTHALSPNSGLHRESFARWLYRHFHPFGEYQSGILDGA
jgi:hypothetical protein